MGVNRCAAAKQAYRCQCLDLVPGAGSNQDGISWPHFLLITIDFHEPTPFKNKINFLTEFVVVALRASPLRQARLSKTLLFHRGIGGIKNTADSRSICSGKGNLVTKLVDDHATW